MLAVREQYNEGGSENDDAVELDTSLIVNEIVDNEFAGRDISVKLN